MDLRAPTLRQLLIATALMAVIGVRDAAAHAILFESTPARNSVITGPTVAIKLRFNVRVDANRSRLALVYPSGSLRALRIKSQQPADLVTADVSELVPGHYDLKWQVLASDGHITQGDIPFAVK